jgi:hypothetical protein
MQRWGWLVVLGLLGCRVELAVDEQAALTCERDEDCPEDWTCGVRQRCVAPGAIEDLSAPQIVTAEASGDSAVVVTFSEPIDAASAASSSSYSIAPGLAVIGVSVDAQSVRLATARQVAGQTYVLTVRRVGDHAGNNLPPDGIEAEFTGGGTPPDTTPPTPLTPAEGARFFDREIILAWAPRSGASSYAVELSRYPSFSPLVVSALPTVGTSLDLVATLAPTSLEPRTYYWRVVSDVTEGSATNPGRSFHVMDDAIYVHCPADPCATAAEVGNLSSPHQSVAVALIDAAANGVREVRVASRGGDLAYGGLVSLQPGVSLYGGYDAMFSVRDPAATPSILEHGGQFVVQGISINHEVADDPTVIVDGFTLRTESGANLVDASGLLLSDCDGSVTIRNNVIRPGNAAGFSRGIVITGSMYPTPVLVTDNDIVAGWAYWGESTGIQVSFSRASIVANRVIAGDNTVEGKSIGLSANAADLLIADNPLITSGDGPRFSYGVLLSGVEGEIRGNVISAGDAPRNPFPVGSIGLERNADDETANMLIIDNDITTGTGAFTLGMVLESGVGLEVAGNRVQAGAATDTSFALSTGIALRKFGSFTIRDNQAFAGPVTTAGTADEPEAFSAGIHWQRPVSGTWRTSSALVSGNLAIGAAATITADSAMLAASYGILIEGFYVQAIVLNNVARAGAATAVAAASSTGVSFAPDSYAYGPIINNTIIGGRTTSTQALGEANGISLSPSWALTSLDVSNNIVFTRGASDTRTAIREVCSSACSLPRTLRNNLLLHIAPSGTTALYIDGNGTPYDDTNADGLLAELSSVAATVNQNITTVAAVADWASLFYDPSGSVTPADHWDNFALAPGNPAIDAGVNFFDGDVLVSDLRGQARPSCGTPPCDTATPPWCIGAYED